MALNIKQVTKLNQNAKQSPQWEGWETAGTDIQTLQTSSTTNTTDIATNAADIVTNAGDITALEATDPGNIGNYGTVVLASTANPAVNTDNVVIGGDTYTFSAAPATDFDMAIGVDGATCMATLIATINDHSTENVQAVAIDTVTTYLIVTDVPPTPGPSTPVIGASSLAVAVNYATPTDLIASEINTNVAAHDAGGKTSTVSFEVTTPGLAMIVDDNYRVFFPFTPTWFRAEVWSSDAQIITTDTFEIEAATDAILIKQDGAGTHISAGDVITITAGE